MYMYYVIVFKKNHRYHQNIYAKNGQRKLTEVPIFKNEKSCSLDNIIFFLIKLKNRNCKLQCKLTKMVYEPVVVRKLPIPICQSKILYLNFWHDITNLSLSQLQIR